MEDNLALLDEALIHLRNKEIQEVYEDIKAELGLKIRRLSKRLDMLATFVGFKPHKQDKID